jgi:hypothetical protein
MPRKGVDRPATGRTFIAAIVVAFVATMVVIVWTFHSLSDRQKEHAVPATFRM